MSLLVVGSVALDSIETPTESREDVLGGSAAYFSAVASLLHGPVRLVAVVGEDFPATHVDFLAKRRVDLDGLQRVSGRTFRWRGRYRDNMVDRDTLDTQLNVFRDFKPVLPDNYKDSEFVFLANIDPRLQLQVLEQIRQPRFVAMDTMNFWLQGEPLGVVKKILGRGIDAIILNDEEARMLSGEHNLVRAAVKIRKLGVKRVVIKRGDAGAQLYDDAHPFWAAAYPLGHVADPTGAGDSFAGGFVSYLAFLGRIDDASVRSAMILASTAASFAVEDFSVDRFRTLERHELVSRCSKFAELVHFEDIVL
jgi:sugar/nucleoside kinase (ribokinase family)